MNLLQRFPKYKPTEEFEPFMNAEVIAIRVDKDRRIMEADVSFASFIERKKMYRLEKAIKDAYQLNSFTINPKFNSSLFSGDCMDDVILEVCRKGVVSNGFFDDYSVEFSKEKIIIKVILK